MRKHIPDEVLVFMAGKFRMLSDPTRLSILRTLMENGEQNAWMIRWSKRFAISCARQR